MYVLKCIVLIGVVKSNRRGTKSRLGLDYRGPPRAREIKSELHGIYISQK